MSMAAAGISASLASIAGPANVIADPVKLSAYRIGGYIPNAAVRPASNQEVADVVRFAASERLSLVPVGAATKLGMGIPLRRYDLAVDLTRLDRVVAYDPDDLTLSVEPGIPLKRLASVLADHRQFLPLTVPFMSDATVGGTIASGVDSPLRQLYGTARDYVLGMEFVTGDGQIAKSGGRVVKNVSGYDLHKLLIGSLGGLGVITKVNFRTFPTLAPVRAFVAFFASPVQAAEMRHRIAQSPLRPLTVEILSPNACELLSAGPTERIEPGRFPDCAISRDRWATLVSYAGTKNVLERYERDLRQMAGAAETASLDEAATSVAIGRVREFIPVALESSSAATMVKMTVVPTRMSALLADIESFAEKLNLGWATIARGVGVIYVAMLPGTPGDADRARVVHAVEQLREACRRSEGNLALLWFPYEWIDTLPPTKSDRDDLDQMRKIKHAFDPGGLFAPDPLSRWI